MLTFYFPSLEIPALSLMSQSGDKARYPSPAAEARDANRAKRPAGSPILNAEKRARIDGKAEQGRV